MARWYPVELEITLTRPTINHIGDCINNCKRKTISAPIHRKTFVYARKYQKKYAPIPAINVRIGPLEFVVNTTITAAQAQIILIILLLKSSDGRDMIAGNNEAANVPARMG